MTSEANKQRVTVCLTRLQSWVLSWWYTYRRNPILNLLIQLSLLSTVFFLVSWHILDPDFGWHLQAGNYIRTHAIPMHDVFTYTARVFPWIDHEWGNDVIVSFLYQLGGYGLVAACFGLLWSNAVLLVTRHRQFFVAFALALAMLPYAGIRPITWTVLLLAVTLRVLQARQRRLLALLPALFLVWANLHGGFIIGLCLMAYIAVYERRKELLPVLLLCVGATFINPYGARLYIEIVRTVFDSQLHAQVNEWAPLVIFPSAIVLLIWWGVGSFLFATRPVRVWLRPTIPLFLAALSATRNFPLFFLAAGQETDDYFVRLKALIPNQLSRRSHWLVRGTLILFVLINCWALYPYVWPLQANREADYPTKAVKYLQAGSCGSGNIFNDYDYGGYLIWKVPALPVYIDGRMPSWRTPDGTKYIDRYFAVLQSTNAYRSEFQTYHITCALLRTVPQNAQLIRSLQADHWSSTVETSKYILLTSPNKE